MLNGLLNSNPSEIMTSTEEEKNERGARLKLSIIEYHLGSPLTDEQRDFAYNFNRDIIAFANPGTGKTHTLTAGILVAQTYWGINPSKIFCMSYTNAATNEIKGRYKNLTGRVNAFTGVVFGTFHSLSNKILRDAYQNMTIVKEYDPEQTANMMAQYIQQVIPDYPFDRKKARQIARVIAELNSAYCFDDEHIKTKYSFKKLEMPIEAFKKLRYLWFERGIITNTIEQGEIPLYCLYALKNNPEAGNLWKGKYDIMIVDEFQDLSLLDLEILNMVAQKLIVVGDMKQQIYVFSGACPEIVDMYKKMKPNATELVLRKSFRCPQAIADLATRVIQPNLEADSGFDGRDDNSNLTIQDRIQIMDKSDIDWNEAFKDITNEKLNDVLILYRNNASTIPVVDSLYEKKIPYRCPKFVKVMDIPVISTMCDLVNAAWQPNDPNMVRLALRHFPEFRKTWDNIPVISAMKSSKRDLFNVNYRYEDETSRLILKAMADARDAINENKKAGAVLMKVKTVYDKFIFKNEWIQKEEVPYYLNMAATVANFRTYPEMVGREQLKELRALECASANMGVRCYTMHSSKGLEGKTVYLLDVNEGVFPNSSIVKMKHEVGCDYDAAIDVRSERNLLYVAITRASEKLVISYSNGSLATLLQSPEANVYSYYDKFYKENHKLFNDTEYFEQSMLGAKK